MTRELKGLHPGGIASRKGTPVPLEVRSLANGNTVEFIARLRGGWIHVLQD